MICDVCGRENADTLTFCQDCGRRLKGRSSRVVPPTPPAGLQKIDLPLPADADAAVRPHAASESAPPASGDAPAPEPRATTSSTPPPRRSRPEAPSFSFAPMEGRSGASGSKPPDRSGPSTPPGDAPCPGCNAVNPPGYRFCMTCGAALAAAEERPFGTTTRTDDPRAPRPASEAPKAAPRAGASTPALHAPSGSNGHDAPAAAAAVSKAPEDGASPSAAPVTKTGEPNEAATPIFAAPVVDIASAKVAPPKLVPCSRCGGQCAPGTRFCKFCGAALQSDGESPPDEAAARAHSPTSEPGPAPGAAGLAHAQELPHPEPPTPRAPARPAPPPVPTSQRSPTVSAPTGRLVVIVEDGSEGRSFPLLDRQLDIGRSEGDILLQDDLYVSPRHARLIPENGRWILRDLNSTNRVYLRIRKPEILRDGDLLLLGLEVLQFQTVSDAERGLGPATQHGTLLFGSPATPRRARLCQRTVEGVVRDVYHLFRDETFVGRETGDIVFTADPFLSRRHAVIRRNPTSGEFTITDLDSSNGSYLALREDAELVNSDFVRIGQHLFRVDLTSGGLA